MNKRYLFFIIIFLAIATTVPGFGQTYNYAEALQKSMFFYECQRSGALPSTNRVNWRGNSGMKDGSDSNVDLTGGWYDAGDHVKFNFPMAFTATALAWGAIEFKQGYTNAGQLSYLKSNLRWANDYFIKCHTAPNELWGQVGSGGNDHAWWGSAEVMQMSRPSYKITASSPGSDLAGETAAAMAAASIVFASDDPTYSATLLSHAKQLYTFADTYRGKYSSSITDASGYYNSWSGYQDELVWGAIWLYLATEDNTYLAKAESMYDDLGKEGQSSDRAYKWTLGWDDKSYGCYVLLAKITGKAKYKTDAEHNLDFWTDGYNGSKIAYTPGGLAWLDQWGSLRYAANASFLALVYSDIATTDAKKTKYYNFAVSQIKYILGNNPLNRSLVCGYGTNPPKNPHHRTAHGAWANNLTGPPTNSRHILYGALVGGPGKSDDYTDDRSNYTTNEVACDYNACFSSALAKLTLDLGGTALANFPTAETPTDEYLAEARINSSGSQYTEYSVWVANHTAWPARIPSQWKYRLFVDITEGLAAGYKVSDYVVSSNGSNVTFTSLQPWDAAKNIYYTEITYNSGITIWPGGQGESTKESQIRIRLPYEAPASAWNPSNDWSYTGLTGTLATTTHIPLYVDGKLVCGSTPTVIHVTGVTVSPTTASVAVGSTTKITATVAPTDASDQTVSWTSSNTAVATVSSAGVVTGVAAGTATITATTTDGAKTATCAVTVANVPVTGVSVNPATLTVGVNGTSQLTATVAPTDATDKTVTWKSSDISVATVSSTGVVTGVALGTATITVTTTDGAKTATCAVTVANISIPVTSVSVNPTTNTIVIGKTTQLTATVLPTNATDKTVSWSSSNTSVATVNPTGLVTGVAIGTSTITVTTTDGAKTATCAITVTDSTSTCTFGTPTASALPTINNKIYKYVYVLGTGGPSLSNVTNFTINWDLPNNGLWQFSMNTNDGKPNWYNDLRTGATQTFASAQPSITLSGTGFTGLDGSYYATVYNTSDFVLVSKTGGFAIYFSNSATAPTCTKSASLALSAPQEKENSMSVYPNPFAGSTHLRVSNSELINEIQVIDQTGRIMLRLNKGQITDNMQIGDELPSGMYIIKVVSQQNAGSYKIVKK